MATTINEPKEITLPDGTVLAVRPLKISILREFMKTFSSIEDVAEDNDKSMDLLIECVRIAMRQYKPELAEDAAKLEDILDLPTVYRIIEEASGTVVGNQFVGGRG
jgi:hypothetical protein